MRITPDFLNSDISRLCAWPIAAPSELMHLAEKAGASALLLPVRADASLGVQGHLIEKIQHATAAIFPAWLPEADGIDRLGGGGREAVAALARAEAQRSDLFGPYLMAVAERALSGKRDAPINGFAHETVTRECHKLFCRAYRTHRVALILDVADNLSDDAVAEAQHAALFIANQQAFLVWLTGTRLERFERVPVVGIDGPREAAGLIPTARSASKPLITPLSGRPNPFSETENRLEAFLCRNAWAVGRVWNTKWSGGVLANPIWVDLLWETERLVVEIDGLDHLHRDKYARDRARDRALQMAGFRVLRFTNAEVAADLARIASEIERFLAQARK